jgi:hypothetical protein
MTLNIISDTFWCGRCLASYPNSERAQHAHPSTYSVGGDSFVARFGVACAADLSLTEGGQLRTVSADPAAGRLSLLPMSEPVEMPDCPPEDAPPEQLLDFGAAIAGLSTPIAKRIVDAYLDKWVRD